MHYLVEPDVAGELGPGTEMDTSVHPPIVSRLEYLFQGWYGDELIESFPCYLATAALVGRLQAHGLTGYRAAEVLITVSPEMRELQPDAALPSFVWLQIVGTRGVDDFALAEDYRLVVSPAAMSVLQGSIDGAIVEEVPD
jgi:hypothetical protein